MANRTETPPSGTETGRDSIVPTEQEYADARSELLAVFARSYLGVGADPLHLSPTMLRGVEQLHGVLIDAIIDSGWENAETTALRERMATLLTETANVIKGDPEPLRSHDWSDLPAAARTRVDARNG